MDQTLIMDKVNRTYQLGLYEKAMPSDLSWEEKLNLTKESGFDYLEMSIDETDAKLARLEWTKEERKAVVDAMWKTGVKINSICLSGHRKYPFGASDPDTQKRSLEIMQKAIDLASDLGVRLIQLAGYDVYYEQGNSKTKADFATNLNKAVLMAAKKGINLGFETMETPFMDTVGKSMYYVNMINSPYLGVYPDIGNLKNASLLYSNPVNNDIRVGQGHIFATHLKETVPGKYREIPFGTGHTEYIENLQLLKAMGVRMFVGEFWYIGSETWKQDLKDASAFLRERLDSVFGQEENI